MFILLIQNSLTFLVIYLILKGFFLSFKYSIIEFLEEVNQTEFFNVPYQSHYGQHKEGEILCGIKKWKK